MTAKLTMLCSRQNNGSYYAVCPELKGCFTQGDTYEEACANLRELIEVTVREELTEEEKTEILRTEAIIFTELEIAI
jgi:predicted RNase H-like HicB family nuclease